jgi:hypothetical protein
MIEIRHIILNSNYNSIVFKYLKIGSGRLISDHLGFQVIRVWVGSGFRSSDLGSSQVWGCLGFGSDRVSNHLISGHLGFQVVWVRVRSGFKHSDLKLSRVSGSLGPGWVGSGSDQFDFLKKSDQIEFGSKWIGRVFRIELDFTTSNFLIGTESSKCSANKHAPGNSSCNVPPIVHITFFTEYIKYLTWYNKSNQITIHNLKH